MTAIDFPNSPSVGDVHTVGLRSWVWTGNTWDTRTTQTIAGPTGPTGAGGPTGPTGPGGVSTAESPIVYNSGTGVISFDRAAEDAYNDLRYASPGSTEIIPLDDISWQFNGVQNRFLATYQNTPVPVTNPYKLLLSINGIMQSVNTQEHLWLSPITPRGFFIDTDGYIRLSEIPPVGSTFDGRIMAGQDTTTKTKNYPFRAIDIMLGAL
jgi:hypothetical protein